MRARAITTYEYRRKVDNVFGRIASFHQVCTHSVEVAIGKRAFISKQTYTSAANARKAAEKLNATEDA
jgi:hypothetical protein